MPAGTGTLVDFMTQVLSDKPYGLWSAREDNGDYLDEIVIIAENE